MLLDDTSHLDDVEGDTTSGGCDDDRRALKPWQSVRMVSLCLGQETEQKMMS